MVCLGIKGIKGKGAGKEPLGLVGAALLCTHLAKPDVRCCVVRAQAHGPHEVGGRC